MMAAVLAAATTFVLGMVVGAAAQRYGDGTRSADHLGSNATATTGGYEPIVWRRIGTTGWPAPEMAVIDDDGAP